MKTSDLLPFREPQREVTACASCRAFKPECLLPDGDAAVPLCWVCAHHVAEHGSSVAHAYVQQCSCLPREIFPMAVITARALREAVLA